ncbi:MAG TPA: hypothetical protein VHA70_16245 [Bauldia sp.]|nr:hypothetical protein [Bauldia sp.]
MTATKRPANDALSLLRQRMCKVGNDDHRFVENTFDLVDRDAVFGAFASIAVIPIESGKRRHFRNVHLYIQMSTQTTRFP